ncbi:MAG: hypothetical protein ABWY18_09285 [Tardiphaga sp.]
MRRSARRNGLLSGRKLIALVVLSIMHAYNFRMADAPKTIREVNVQIEGLEKRLDQVLKIGFAAIGIMTTLAAAGVGIYIQLNSLGKTVEVESAKAAQHFEYIERTLAEVKSANTLAFNSLNRIELRLASSTTAGNPPLNASAGGPQLTFPDRTALANSSATIAAPPPAPNPTTTGTISRDRSSTFLTADEVDIIRAARLKSDTTLRAEIGDRIPTSSLKRLPASIYQRVPVLANIGYVSRSQGGIALGDLQSGEIKQIVQPKS